LREEREEGEERRVCSYRTKRASSSLFFAIDQVACGLISGAGSTLFVTRQEPIGFWIFLRCEECRRTWRFWEIGRLARMSAPKMVNGD